VGTTYRGHLWADAIAIGCKQFAATLLALVYLAEKNWRRLALTIVVFGAWAIPFVLWNPTAFYCHALVFQIPTSCQGGIVSTSPFSGGVNFNYLLWPLFAVAIYRIPIWKWMHTTFRWMTRPDSLLGNYGVYLGIGSLSAGVNLLAFLLTSGHMAIIAASVTASTIAGVVAFIGHYHGTFRERHTRPWTHHLGFFVPIAILSIAINAILASVLSGHGMIPWAAQGVGLMCGSVAGFGANRRFNFHHKTVVQEDA
jgi:putative flippase GtrA